MRTDEAQTLPISRKFRERVYPLEYVALIKYNELTLSLSLSLSVWQQSLKAPHCSQQNLPMDPLSDRIECHPLHYFNRHSHDLGR